MSTEPGLLAVAPLGEPARAAVEAYLDRRLVECLFLASNLESGGLEDGDGMLQGLWLGAWSGQAVVGVAQCVNQGSLLVAVSAEGAAAALAEAVHLRGYRPLRVLGMRPEVAALHAALAVRGGYPVREVRDSLLQVLTPETFEARPGPGMRLATDADVPRLLEWKREFRIQAMGDDPSWVDMDVLRRSLELSVGEGRQFVFEAGGRLVSMARVNASSRRMAQLGGLYTPPPERGNGYASRLVSSLCARCFRQDHKEAVALMVEEEKEHANAIYRRLGFLGLGTYRFLLLEDGAA